ncbi:hypothetical protein CLV92_10283 [Kineococcus xinjiangensis]|uniref:Uncharacterized protein n=1 Tax=Kineococcus xinjiangensis TaxID=512762 RepID=A0A2S6IUV3_9ACTN|nr:hypothetical protein [Kineococcus xinjiangensis]PPK97933.1 hypothetical protein CLV92_10283 [Kineococcus xinjiangensis]
MPEAAPPAGAAPDDAEDWRRRRSEDAEARAAVHERARAEEHRRARDLLAGFVAELHRRGIPPVALRAGADGPRHRTGLQGWYLKRNGSLGVSTEGDYYVLAVVPSLRERLTGIRLQPGDPPLQVGRGARDGESVALAELLRQRLAELGGESPEHPGH